MSEDWEDDFVVDLGEGSWESSPLPSVKRHKAAAATESLEEGAPPAAHRQAATGGGSCALPPPPPPGASQHGGWSVRSIFLGSGATSQQHTRAESADQRAQQQPAALCPPPQQQQQQHQQQQRHLPPSPGLGYRGSHSAARDADDGVGPLTQMAASNAGVAAAFCPGCACFLADLGGPAQQAEHAAACQQQQQQRSSGAPRAQAQRDADADAGSLDGGGSGGSAGDSEEGELDGNCSEQEEATQRVPSSAAPGAADGQPDSDSDGWHDDTDGAEAAEAEAGTAGVEAEEAEEGAVGGAPTPCDEEQAALRSWLHQHGLAKYAEHFERAGAGLSLLPCLTDSDLRQLGVVALGARKKLLLAAEELVEAAEAAVAVGEGTEGAAAGGEQQPRLEGRRGGGGVGDWRALMAGAGGAVLSCSILRYFQPQGGGKPRATKPANPGSILSYLRGADGGALPVPPPAKQAGVGAGRGKQAAQKQWAHKAAGGGGGGGKRWGPRAAQVLPMRQWQLVPNTPFVVDRFCNLPAQSPYRHWFLTHFHADHYKGLNGKFNRGTIYCTPPTARLVVQQLRVKPGCIREVPLNSPITVEGVRCTFLDANHCPGAAMILFEPPGRRAVLHTGDCRLIPEMQQEPALVAVRGRADLILDTTYCSPEYAFPSQQEVLRFAIDAVKAEAFNPKTLFLFGSYTIGKERLFLEAARVLQRKVYVSVAKRKILDCLDLPEEYRCLLTTDDRETNLHAVPLWMVSQQHMSKLLKHYRGRFANAVGFQPTGWAHQRDANQTRARGRRRQKGTLITYQVPYSEHSSFSELRAFCEWFRPGTIIPSVNSDGGGPKAQALVRLLLRGGGGGG